MTEEMQFWKPFSYKSQSFIYGGVYPVILYQKFANFWSKLKQLHGAPLFLGAFYTVLQFGGTKPRQNGYCFFNNKKTLFRYVDSRWAV